MSSVADLFIVGESSKLSKPYRAMSLEGKEKLGQWPVVTWLDDF